MSRSRARQGMTAPRAAAQPTARLGAAAVVAGVLIVVALHFWGPGAKLSAMRDTISAYTLTSVAWIFDIVVLLVALGVALIGVAAWSAVPVDRPLPRADTGPGEHPVRLGAKLPPNEVAARETSYLSCRSVARRTAGLLLMLVSAAGLVLVAVFQKTDWATGATIGGTIHRAGAAVAFLALPAAVIVFITGRGQPDRPGRAGRRPWPQRCALVCAVAAPLWLVPVVVAVLAVGSDGRWWLAVPLGLIERGMALTELAALLLLAAEVRRPRTLPSGTRRPR